MRNERKEIATKMRSSQRAIWRQSGCLFVDSLVVIWKLTARRTHSEPSLNAKPSLAAVQRQYVATTREGL